MLGMLVPGVPVPDLGFVPEVAPRPVNVDSETEPALLVLGAETDLSTGVAILGLAFGTDDLVAVRPPGILLARLTIL